MSLGMNHQPHCNLIEQRFLRKFVSMKLQTPVTPDPAPVSVSYNDRILVLGSCFADEIGARLMQAGFLSLIHI